MLMCGNKSVCKCCDSSLPLPFTSPFLCQGEGCGLMGASTKYCRIVHSMSRLLDCPLTVKMRTGVLESKNTAHTLIPRLREAGAALCTVG